MEENLNPINNIVAATDFSNSGDLAVLRAAHIAQKNGTTLHLLHVVHPLDIYPELMLTYDSHLKDYERVKQANGLDVLDKLAVKIRKDFEITVRTATRIGRPHVQIAEFAKTQSASLLVVGHRSERNLLDVVLGSTAFRLLRTAPCAVLVVKNPTFTPYKQAIVAIDLSSISLNVSLMACHAAPGAQVELLHVFDLKQALLNREVGTSDTVINQYRDEALKYVASELDQLVTKLADQRVSSKMVHGYLPEAIQTSVLEHHADLVVLGKKGKSNLQEFVLGSVSKTVAGMVECDVLLT